MAPPIKGVNRVRKRNKIKFLTKVIPDGQSTLKYLINVGSLIKFFSKLINVGYEINVGM